MSTQTLHRSPSGRQSLFAMAHHDPLRAARGILVAFAVGLLFWSLLIALLARGL